jgi:hypothetical protein
MKKIVALALALSGFGCDMSKLAVRSTAKVLQRGQASMRQESDYDMAARAAPGSLKTVEALLMTDPDHRGLKTILADGYCQYAGAFIEDEWEVEKFAKNYDRADEIAARATKAYYRCVGYALELLGPSWKTAINGPPDGFEKLVAQAGPDERDAMMTLSMGLGGAINLNKDNVDLVAHLGKVRMLIDKVMALDAKNPPADALKRTMPYLVDGRLRAGMPEALGGKPELGKKSFDKAYQLTNQRHLLALVMMAQTYAVATQNRKLFRNTLVKVLQTDPASWPEERLMMEIAHRRAKRYLKQEKAWF